MKIRHTLILALLTICFSAIAQETPKQKSASQVYLDSVYSIGWEGYKNLLVKQVKVPSESFREGSEGVLIVQIKMSKEGKVSARFMTKVDQHVEASFSEYLKNYTDQWVFDGEPYEVYQLFGLSVGTYWSRNLAGEVKGYPEKFEPPFAPIIVSRTVRSVGPPIRIKVERNGNDPRSGEEIAREKLKQMERDGTLPQRGNRRPEPIPKETTLEKYMSLKEKFEGHLSKNKLKKAHNALTQVIRFNPFDIDLLLKRVELEQELGINEFQGYDIPWIVALRKLKARGKI